MFDVEKIRKDFPMLRGLKMQGKPLVYFDNAATTFKPYQVIESINDYLSNYTSNIHRGDYDIAFKADSEYENTRKVVAKFINSKSNEVVFTSGASMGLNMIAFGWKNNLSSDDEILIDEAEHASNILPWFRIAKEIGCKIKYIPLDEEGKVTPDNLKKVISNKTKIVAVAHISNVLGYINDVESLISIAHEHNSIFVLDAAQSVPHLAIDVKKLDCDFMVFSGHKMCGPTGVGVLFGKYSLLEKLEPIILGGGMNNTFDLCGDVSYLYPPQKFEAGTQNIEGVIGLARAIEYLSSIGMDEIEKYEKYLKEYAINRLKDIPNLTVYNMNSPTGIITFNVDGVHAQDEGSLLNSKGICVRSGQHCAKLLNNKLGVESTVRASMYFYNTIEEIDAFVEALRNGGDFLDAFFN